MADNEKNASGEQPKIIIDSDWKAQAKAEKERLSKEVDTKAKAAPAPGPGGAAAGAALAGGEGGAGEEELRELPPASFATLVHSLATQTLYALGGMEDPETGRRYVDLDLAKHHIDTLAVLEEKTKGNLADSEQRLLNQALYETRMHYVNIAQRLAPSQ